MYKYIHAELLDGRHLSHFTGLERLLLGLNLPKAAEGASSRASRASPSRVELSLFSSISSNTTFVTIEGFYNKSSTT